MNRKIVVVTIVAMAIMWAGCYRCHKARNYRQHQATHKYLPSVKAGSYYVYRNVADATDQDTLYVVQNLDSMVFQYTEKPCDGDYLERQFINMVFAGDKDTVSQSIYSGSTDDSYSMHGKYRHATMFSYYSTDAAGNILLPTTDTLSKLPSYTAAGNTYNDVICISTPVLTVGALVRFYYAAAVGIIQFDVYDPENAAVTGTYQLVSYSIKQ